MILPLVETNRLLLQEHEPHRVLGLVGITFDQRYMEMCDGVRCIQLAA